MKVIDLLNKIANCEEVPKKIIINDIIYYLIDYGNDTKLYQSIVEPYDILNIKTNKLNNEVEIIEDIPKEIYFDEEDIKAEKEAMKKLSVEKKDNFYDYYKEDAPISKLYVNNELQYDLTPKEDKKIEKMEFCYEVDDKMQNANNERFKDFINEIIDKVNGE